MRFLLLGLCLHLRGCASMTVRPLSAEPASVPMPGPDTVRERLQPGVLWSWSGNACLLVAVVLLLQGLSQGLAARLAVEDRRSHLWR